MQIRVCLLWVLYGNLSSHHLSPARHHFHKALTRELLIGWSRLRALLFFLTFWKYQSRRIPTRLQARAKSETENEQASVFCANQGAAVCLIACLMASLPLPFSSVSASLIKAWEKLEWSRIRTARVRCLLLASVPKKNLQNKKGQKKNLGNGSKTNSMYMLFI